MKDDGDDEQIEDNDDQEDLGEVKRVKKSKKSKKGIQKAKDHNKPTITYDDEEEEQQNDDAVDTEKDDNNIENFKTKLVNILLGSDFSEKRSRKLGCDDFLELLA